MTSPSSAPGQLQVDQLCKSYPARSGPLCVLDGVALELAAGTSAAVVGPSGCGKSTLLHLLGGLDRPTSGTVRLEGVDPHALPEAELARFRNQTIGFVFQEHYLLPQCSALENVLVPTLPAAGADSAAEQRALGLLDRVGLAARVHHRPTELSGGERQRAAIARALMNRPKLLLCDEPTGNLDHRSAAAVADLLLELHRDDGAVLLVATHSAELAGRMSRRFELQDGRLVALP